MDKKDRNIKPGDSEIVTKKGFLITPPKKNAGKTKPASAEHQTADTAVKGAFTSAAKEAPNKNESKEPREKKGFRQRSRAKAQENSAPQPIEKREEQKEKEREKNTRANKFRHGKKGGEKQPERPQNSEKHQKNQQQNRDKNDKYNRNNHRRPEKSEQKDAKQSHNQNNNGKTGKIDPSILSDLGFVSDSFRKRRKTESSSSDEPEVKIDYSKAIPLRDQIYPPKKESAPELTEADREGKTEIIGVRFKEAGKIYYFDPNGTQIPYATPVIVETARGLEYGYTAISNRFIPTDTIVSPLKKIIRIATKEDKERLDANKLLEKQAVGVFEEKVAKLGLEMALVGVEYTFDNTKLLFYFAAENRIDFRELVKELASVFRTRIELRQVGVRDEAKLLGGLGVCGRPLCCSTFLGEFAQVSIKMAKDQSLSLNSSKISGTCGRLLCCLRYEDEVYQQEYERTPKVDAIVETNEGRGIVVETNPLKGIVRVRLDSRREAPPQAFHRDDVKIIGYQRGNDNNVDAELKELEKE